MSDSLLTIGQLAARADVHIETVRYYQRLGLIAEPQRPLGGIRRYGDKTIARLRFIKRAQQLGFTLDEVGNLLTLDDGQSCRETRLLAQKKLAIIEVRLADLSRMRKVLKALITECAAGSRPRSCPIIDSLSGNVTLAAQ